MTLLTELKPTLPSPWYYDPDHYVRELRAIWYRDWVCVGRLEEVPLAGDYRVVAVGEQRLIVTRNGEGQVKVFHNTCRHRGSTLCTAEKGHFPNGRIICPYHTWTYSLDGELLATPSRVETDDFRARDFSLYAVHSDSWGGFLFVNLSSAPAESLIDFLGVEAKELESWPLADMVSVHQEHAELKCNWKVFWENYSECYHCPRLHPELCKVVPAYKKGLLSHADDPEWQACDDDGRPRVAAGKKTWTLDGQSSLPLIEGLSDAERDIGMNFASFTACLFVVGHPDYVRSVRLVPTGPESITLVIDWLLLPGVAESHGSEIEPMLELGRLVVEQDGRACELNQQGLRSSRHESGVLVPQEYGLWEFHEWLRGKLADDRSA
jgi:Rieske 2Fe-2S family protein